MIKTIQLIFSILLVSLIQIPLLGENDPLSLEWNIVGEFCKDGIWQGAKGYTEINRGKFYGSYCNGDKSKGRIQSSPFESKQVFRLHLIGDFSRNNINIYLIDLQNQEKFTLTESNYANWVDETWELPSHFVNKKLVLVAEDNDTTHGGWLAFSLPSEDNLENKRLFSTNKKWTIKGEVGEKCIWKGAKRFSSFLLKHKGLPTLGTYCNGDASKGEVISPEFIAPDYLKLYLIGSFSRQDINIHLEVLSSGKQMELRAEDFPNWDDKTWKLPEWVENQKVRIKIVDNDTTHGGWIGVSHPIRGDSISLWKKVVNWGENNFLILKIILTLLITILLFTSFLFDLKEKKYFFSGILILSFFAILIIRKGDALMNPQFWAEDGVVFFLQQYYLGAESIFTPYAGYLHLTPRLIAQLGEYIPYRWIPHFYNYMTCLVYFFLLRGLLSKGAPIKNYTLLILGVCLIPHHKNEVFFSITNIQWLFALYLPFIVVKEERLPLLWSHYLTYFILIIIGLTGPFILFAAPLFLWRLLRNRSSINALILFAISAFCSLIQFYFVITTSTKKANELSIDFDQIISLLGNKFMGGFLFGDILTPYLPAFFLAVLFLLFPLLVLIKWKEEHARFSFLVFYAFGMLVVLATINKFKGNLSVLFPPAGGTRYFFIPYVMFFWCLLLCFEQTQKSILRKIIGGIFCLILFSSLSSSFVSAPFKDYNWEHYSQEIGKGEKITIPINPEGWNVGVKN